MKSLLLSLCLLLVSGVAQAGGMKASTMSQNGLGAQTVAAEPPPGTLRLGKIVYVDDKTYPAGTIKKITGGNTDRGIPRTKECVAR